MGRVEHAVQTARAGIDIIERERRERGLSLYCICDIADAPDNRKFWRMVRGGDVKLSWFIRYARAIGYELMLVKRDEAAKQDGDGHVRAE